MLMVNGYWFFLLQSALITVFNVHMYILKSNKVEKRHQYFSYCILNFL